MPKTEQDPEAIRNALTREVTTDAYNIASQIFPGPQGDVSHVSNAQLDERYRQAFANNEREWLTAEATRDPTQFLAAVGRLGVTMPPGEDLPQEEPLPKSARSDVPVPKAPSSALPTLYDTPDQVPTAQGLPSPPAAPGPVPVGGPIPMVAAPPQPAVQPVSPPPPPVPPPPGVL